MFLFAQANPQAGFEVVQESLDLAQKTVEAWEETWELVISPDSDLWQALVKIGIFLATICILYLVMTEGKDALENQSFSDLIKMMAMPIVIMIFLGGNGTGLSQLVLAIRGYSHFQVQEVLKFEAPGFGLGEAVAKVGVGAAAIQQVEALYSECAGKAGEELSQCITTKQAQAQEIVAAAEAEAGPLPELKQKVDGLASAAGAGGAGGAAGGGGIPNPFGDLFKNAIIFVAKGILWSLQWGFVNLLEIALLLTALMSPIAMGLSLLPFQGRPIFAWLVGFMSLFGMQLSYNIITGLVATVLIKSEASIAGDLAFIVFLSLLAPVLATSLNIAAGSAIFMAASNRAASLGRFAAGTALTVGTGGAGLAVGAAAGAASSMGGGASGSGSAGSPPPSAQKSLPPAKGEFGV